MFVELMTQYSFQMLLIKSLCLYLLSKDLHTWGIEWGKKKTYTLKKLVLFLIMKEKNDKHNETFSRIHFKQ